MAIFTEEVDFSTVVYKIRDGQQISMQVRDIENVLKDTIDPFPLGKHADRDVAHACG
jgi:hypothetical protein